jgi:hypothetical protein
MRITVNLRLRNSQKRKDGTCTVYARCMMEGSRIELSKGIFISDESWDPDIQMVRDRKEKIRTLNSKLDKFVSKIYDASNQFEATKENFSLLNLKEKLFPNRSKLWGYHRHLKKVLNDAIAVVHIQRNPYISYKVKSVAFKTKYCQERELIFHAWT